MCKSSVCALDKLCTLPHLLKDWDKKYKICTKYYKNYKAYLQLATTDDTNFRGGSKGKIRLATVSLSDSRSYCKKHLQVFLVALVTARVTPAVHQKWRWSLKHGVTKMEQDEKGRDGGVVRSIRVVSIYSPQPSVLTPEVMARPQI